MKATSTLIWVLASVLTTAAVAGDEDRPAGESVADSLAVRVSDVLDEVAPALADLEAAGVAPTQDEVFRFLQEENQAAGSRTRKPSVLEGSVKWRSGYDSYGLWDQYGKLIVETPWLRGRARFRQYRSGLREATGTLEVGGETLEFRLGRLGLVQGFGLLCGAPGRGQSLTADSGLGPRSDRLVSWLGADDPRALKGVGIRAQWESWRFRGLIGSRLTSGPDPEGKISVAQLTGGGDDWDLSVGGLRGTWSRGASLASSWRKGHLAGNVETMAWSNAPGIPFTGAAVLQLRWSRGSVAGLEGQWGYSDLTGSPLLASRPGVLPGWSSQGFALRGFIRAGPGLKVRALVHLGNLLDRVGVRTKNDKTLIDLQASKTLSRPVALGFRYRSSGIRTWFWSERYPWQSPQAKLPQRRTTVTGHLQGEWTAWRGRILVRSYGLDREFGGGRRTLLSLSGWYLVSGSWRLRGSWVTAWGDPVDLVSAMVPITGMVLARHWGQWRSETVLGWDWSRGPGRVQAAVSQRYPELESGSAPVWTAWAQAGVRW